MHPTLNQLNQALKETAEKHQAIKSYMGFTTDSKINETPDKQYPLLSTAILPSNLSNTNSSFDINIRVQLQDRLNDSNNNDTEVHSDTLQTINDFFVLLRHDYRDMFILPNDIPVSPFTEKNDDMTAGWFTDVLIRIPNTQDYCAIPQV